MGSFSERYNLKPYKTAQINDMDSDLRVSLWNVFYGNYKTPLSTDEEIGYHLSDLFTQIWCDFLKRLLNNFSYNKDDFLKMLCEEFFDQYWNLDDEIYLEQTKAKYKWPWWKVYDFLEFVSDNDKNLKRKLTFQKECNSILERELSGYRFIDGLIVPITSKNETEEIENAIQNSTNEIQTHLHDALILFSDKKNPDYRNSIKESISAVEAQCKFISEDKTATLTKALDKIEKGKQVIIHPYLKEAFQKIYGWTNDDSGIRHALKDQPTVTQEDAQFMLIACSAFINYLNAKKIKTDSQENGVS
jgi:hypothetical protein